MTTTFGPFVLRREIPNHYSILQAKGPRAFLGNLAKSDGVWVVRDNNGTVIVSVFRGHKTREAALRDYAGHLGREWL